MARGALFGNRCAAWRQGVFYCIYGSSPRLQILGVAFRIGDIDPLMMPRRFAGCSDQVLAVATAKQTAKISVPEHRGFRRKGQICHRHYGPLDRWKEKRIAESRSEHGDVHHVAPIESGCKVSPRI